MNIGNLVIRMVGYLCSIVPCEIQLPELKVPRLTRDGKSLDELTNPVVSVPSLGAIQGTYSVSVRGRQFGAFQGIPYAVPPIGKLRFKVLCMIWVLGEIWEFEFLRIWFSELRDRMKFLCF